MLKSAPVVANGRRALSLVVSTLLVVFALVCLSPRWPTVVSTTDTLPSELSDDRFWELIDSFSEPGGYFRSDNLISNEDTFQHVIPELQRRLPSGGVYLGVGPDQNFTYIEALEPQMAFVVDIRRENMLLHLMYKALIEQSSDRAELLSRLFSRPRPSGLSELSTTRDLFDAYEVVAPDRDLFDENLAKITQLLVGVHHFALSQKDLDSIEYIYRAFFESGPELRYSMPRSGGFGGRFFPSYAELMMETDSEGVQHSYLATERNYQTLREYELKNLIVPIVGDFAGDKAVRAVGDYLRENGATVRLFYTSNVEQYLFQSNAWRHFYSNVAALPVDDTSTLLRSHFNMGFRMPFGSSAYSARSGMLLDSIRDLLNAVHEGRIRTYYNVIEHSQ